MTGVRDAAWNILTREGIVPGESLYRAHRNEVTARGRVLARTLLENVGSRTWERGLEATGRRSMGSDAIRVLGFGSSLTSFLVADIALSPPMREAVIELGALANLIVALYDEYVDRGHSADILPRSVLGLAMHSRGRAVLRMASRLRSPPARLCTALVCEYFKRLDGLEHARDRTAEYRSMLRMIGRMYLAERETLDVAGGRRRRTLRRKSALPIVVMGVTWWLASDVLDRQQAWRQLRMLYGMGLLLGYVDDAVDEEEDRRSGRASLLSLTDNRRFIAEFSRLAQSAARKQRELSSPALGIVIASWFGGPAMLAQTDDVRPVLFPVAPL